MKIKVLGSSLKSEDLSFIKSIFVNTGHPIPDIKDILSHEIKTDGSEVVVTFGKKATNTFVKTKQQCVLHLEFPEVKLLLPSPDNEDNRQYVYDQLVGLRDNLATPQEKLDKVITEESLPALGTEDMLNMIRKVGTKEWRGQTRDGKTIKLTSEPTQDNPADVNLTFAEFFVLKAAMETLQVKEFQIVYSNKSKE